MTYGDLYNRLAAHNLQALLPLSHPLEWNWDHLQARHLAGSLEHHLLGNHIFANAKALVFAGCFFNGPEADEWRRRGLRILAEQFEEQVLAIENLAPYFQIELYRDGAMDTMRVMTEAQHTAADSESRAVCEQLLVNSIKESVGVSCEVMVQEPGGVPRSQGKAVRVVDKRTAE